MKLMVEGWREDFNDPTLPVGVIGFCAGGDTQNEDNFEAAVLRRRPLHPRSRSGSAWPTSETRRTPRSSRPTTCRFPACIPRKKREHGMRAARWALAEIYGLKGMLWETASLVSAEPQGDEMILTFDKEVMPDDMNSIPRGFSIAGEDGKFYMAHARYRAKDGQNSWTDANAYNTGIIHVWSPLVEKPVAVRYGWATSPMGNLKVERPAVASLPEFPHRRTGTGPKATIPR